jgi:hypothetical protein
VAGQVLLGLAHGVVERGVALGGRQRADRGDQLRRVAEALRRQPLAVRLAAARRRAGEGPQPDLVVGVEQLDRRRGGVLDRVQLRPPVAPAGAAPVGRVVHRTGDVEHEQDPGLLLEAGPDPQDLLQHGGVRSLRYTQAA